MWPFNRPKKPNTTSPRIPAEVKEYYQAEHRERVGIAWLIAFITLVVTVVVVLGLFFGGRWTYRKLAHKDSTTTSHIAATKSENHDKQHASTPTARSQKPTTNAPQTTPQPATTPNQTTTSPNTSVSATVPSTSSSSPASPNLANTGPGDTLGIFLIVSTLAGLSHTLVMRRKITRRFL